MMYYVLLYYVLTGHLCSTIRGQDLTSVVNLKSFQNIPNDKTHVLDNFIDFDEVLHEKDRELEHDHNNTNLGKYKHIAYGTLMEKLQMNLLLILECVFVGRQ